MKWSLFGLGTKTMTTFSLVTYITLWHLCKLTHLSYLSSTQSCLWSHTGCEILSPEGKIYCITTSQLFLLSY